ncbi:hypothetical protein PFISCL1PPCAC_25038 [Pristionchus fissidentatus]|uniref:Tyrosine phosphatase n=1 Tax=Pristionchus fissidentatus TaxID=1538716 RepID=A0AAV5WRU7_9BILA|nr:hypothetical protein PFISCL1PPCAC_25038 [Pristionchus fissidentatus]
MGNRQQAPSKPEEKKSPPIRKTPAARTRDPSATPSKKTRQIEAQMNLDKTQRRTDGTQNSSDPPKTPAKKDETTAKEIKSKESNKKGTHRVPKAKNVMVDGVLVRRPGAASTKDKNRRRPTPKTSSNETTNSKKSSRKLKDGRKGSSSSERSAKKQKQARKRPEDDRSTEKTGEEKTQDSSARRKRLSNKKKQADNEERKTEKTERTEEGATTKDETTAKTVDVEDDNTLVSDAPKRKKYSSEKEKNVKAFMQWIIGKGVKGLKEEFEGMKRESAPSRADCVEFYKEENITRRRYKDVPCLDESRVVLRDREGANDFIHANFCSTPSSDKRFICTQGPSDSTFNDFWTMINQEEVEYIIMLCNFFEQEKPKCGKYVPQGEGETMETDDYRIQCMAVHNYKLPENVVFRKLNVAKKDSDKDRTVHHFLWETWPDRGVPPIDHSLFKLLAKAGKSKQPIVVHCSAGIGRTGTMVTTQIAMEMLNSGESLADGLSTVVKKLRKQRAMSVQTDHQYIFVHRILLEYFKDTVDEDEITAFCDDFKKLTS